MKKMRRTTKVRSVSLYLSRLLTLWGLDALEKIVEWLFWSCNDQLLEEVFEKFIDLVFLEILLDGLHVVKFLEFVHIVGFL